MGMPAPVAFMRSRGGVLLAAPIRVGTLATAGAGVPAVNGPFTPAANSRLFLLAYARRGSSGTIDVPVASDNLGSTWVSRGDAYNSVPITRERLSLWELAIGGSPAEMSVTTNFGAGATSGSSIIQVQGYAGAVTNVCKDEATTAGDGALTFGAAIAPSSLALAAIASTGSTAWAAGQPTGGYTELYQFTAAGPQIGQVAWDAASAGSSVAWTSTNGTSAALGWEIPVA